MRIRCHLRTIRGPRGLRELARESGLNAGDLSKLEKGIALPRDKDIATLERIYGAPIEDWYPTVVHRAMEPDDDEEKALAARLHQRLDGLASA